MTRRYNALALPAFYHCILRIIGHCQQQQTPQSRFVRKSILRLTACSQIVDIWVNHGNFKWARDHLLFFREAGYENGPFEKVRPSFIKIYADGGWQAVKFLSQATVLSCQMQPALCDVIISEALQAIPHSSWAIL